MRRTALILVPLLLIGCASPGGAESPNDELVAGHQRLEARMLGLTEELDRVSRRLRVIEAGLDPAAPTAPTAPPAETIAKASPDPAPSPDISEEVRPTIEESATRLPTGLLLDVRPLGADVPAGTVFTRWVVRTPEGETLFAFTDVPEEIRSAVPIFWQAESGTAPGPELTPQLGADPLRPLVTSAEIAMAEEPEAGEGETLVLTLPAKAGRDVRELENLSDLLRAGNLVILVRPGE